MRSNTYIIYLMAWLGLVVLAIVNGGLRNGVYGPAMAELLAHQISTVTFLLILSAYVFLLIRWRPLASRGQAWRIGLSWLTMTILFEFVFGHYVMKHPWNRLLHDYNLLEGRLWLLVLIATAVLPGLFVGVGQRDRH